MDFVPTTPAAPPCFRAVGPGAVIFDQRWAVASGVPAVLFSEPAAVLSATEPAEVPELLTEVSRRVNSEGLYAVGMLSYEAGPGMDPAIAARSPGPFPCAWFALYRGFSGLKEFPRSSGKATTPASWHPEISPEAYKRQVEEVRAKIAAGETYQVNLSYRLTANIPDENRETLAGLFQPGCFNAIMNTGTHLVASGSPEMFFRLDGESIRCRPMKGTAARGPSNTEDDQQEKWLHDSEKNRAENIMIVDMIRNDLGKIAGTGTVVVESLFDIERYPNVLQMTSTVSAQTKAGWPDIFKALFPCASITGAPKVQTTQLIKKIEGSQRGIYTGAIGWMGPGRKGLFSVAIRTACLDLKTGETSYGTGSGITWSSTPDEEFQETIEKTIQLFKPQPEFEILETLLCYNNRLWFLNEHLTRMASAARYFGFPWHEDALRGQLDTQQSKQPPGSWRLRMLLNRNGQFRLEWVQLPPGTTFNTEPGGDTPSIPYQLAPSPIETKDPFVFHKTTNRTVYDSARGPVPAGIEVILYNERNELTEGTFTNLVVKKNGRWLTPPVGCGLLDGVFRNQLVSGAKVHEALLLKEDLQHCEEVWLVNSVRGWSKGIPA